jgi:hypothetical protein
MNAENKTGRKFAQITKRGLQAVQINAKKERFLICVYLRLFAARGFGDNHVVPA